MWTDVWKAAEVIGLAIGAAGAVVLIGFLVWREIRKHMKEALEPIEAEVRPSQPSQPPHVPGSTMDSMSLRNLVVLATSSIQNIHTQLGTFVTIIGSLDSRVSAEQAKVRGEVDEFKRTMEQWRDLDRRDLAALAIRVKAMEDVLGKRGYDTLMEAHATATVAIAEALTSPNPNTPPTGVPRVPRDKS